MQSVSLHTDYISMTQLLPRVKAVLGPTNTGKTHLAMDRMLAHASGIIGFPLRLLARENYDRMVATKGADRVALITGEEKIIPPGARWFACTVEAMPLDRAVEWIGVDEIQLCADPDRGHVFTDRLLHARGMVETMFLGAETIRPLLKSLVPQAEIETRPRLSELRHAGAAKLGRLPPRSAIVAFSAGDVYAIAELIRRRKGGCAVVMGRLSPRTRNAQVALYQDKEVDFLVATDAIGMGLNMDVDHVAFARLSKFDGHRARRLAAPEIAQIAGRAGRGMRDGTFGTTADCPPLPEELVEAVETHRFEAIGQLAWRNADLDFSDGDALLASLNAPPPRTGLVRGHDASDVETLDALLRDQEIRTLVCGHSTRRSRVRLLWETCQIPDFRKLADDTHTKLCGRVFLQVLQRRTLQADWLASQIDHLARADGDIDTLMQRLSGIRVWSYIAAHQDWVNDAPFWQGRTREVEDLLSDALHEKLTARFVDRRATHLLRRLEDQNDAPLLSAVTQAGQVIVEGHAVGHITGFGFEPEAGIVGEERKLVMRAARRALRESMPRRVISLEATPDQALSISERLEILWEGHPIARLRAGPTLLNPMIAVADSEFLDGSLRERIRLRLQAWLDRTIATAMAPLFQAQEAARPHAMLRGHLHRLMENGGLVPGATEDAIPPAERSALKQIGVRAGRFGLSIPALRHAASVMVRARLLSIARGLNAVPSLPHPALVSMPLAEASRLGWPPDFAEAMGWVRTGPVYLRLDIAERIAAELQFAARRGPVPLPAGLAGRLSVPTAILPMVLKALGLRIANKGLEPSFYGPPAPPMLVPLPRRDSHRETSRETSRRPPPPKRPTPVAPDHPFSALAALRR
ncbi:ATP-dependent DNA helicase [Granulibacter bethesdensis CGDNIH1]|uniref:ATP-dependent DNA helicase n=2 Tax=Granulibacter bethesdensis TaxID=364410 RepID=Q0BVD9_GRABC|nr:ATP-dependent DNA helicase [Granulibacter bethesdensis CGDNIH1]APH50996.1 ATP-dependent DNA helicase [Granulibacter bethesdensis]APH63691.1 ATP-dependent DNA helicase [Granulibacter bethesdensis]